MSEENSIENSETELKDLVTQALEDNGLLAKIRAQLRAGLYVALENEINETNKYCHINESLKSNLENPELRIIFKLVYEFLEYFNLDFTKSVFQKETYFDRFYSYDGPEKLLEELEISTDSLPKVPILVQILRLAQKNLFLDKTQNVNRTYDIPSVEKSSPNVTFEQSDEKNLSLSSIDSKSSDGDSKRTSSADQGPTSPSEHLKKILKTDQGPKNLKNVPDGSNIISAPSRILGANDNSKNPTDGSKSNITPSSKNAPETSKIISISSKRSLLGPAEGSESFPNVSKEPNESSKNNQSPVEDSKSCDSAKIPSEDSKKFHSLKNTETSSNTQKYFDFISKLGQKNSPEGSKSPENVENSLSDPKSCRSDPNISGKDPRTSGSSKSPEGSKSQNENVENSLNDSKSSRSDPKIFGKDPKSSGSSKSPGKDPKCPNDSETPEKNRFFEKNKALSALSSLSELPALQISKNRSPDAILLPSRYSREKNLKGIDKIFENIDDDLYEEDDFLATSQDQVLKSAEKRGIEGVLKSGFTSNDDTSISENLDFFNSNSEKSDF